MHIIHIQDFRGKISDNCLNIALSIQFHHAINIPPSYPLKFACYGCWQINQKKHCCTRKKLVHLTLIKVFAFTLESGTFQNSGKFARQPLHVTLRFTNQIHHE